MDDNIFILNNDLIYERVNKRSFFLQISIPMVEHVNLSPNKHSPRNDKIRKIAIHHVAGVVSAEALGNIFKPASRRASSNYGVDKDGRIGMYVEEKDRSWCTSSPWCDHQAITIEVSNSATGDPWPVSDHVLERTIELCVDICVRNNIYPCTYTGGKDGTLQMHKWYAPTACPGEYLGSKFPYIAAEVTKRLEKLMEKPADDAPYIPYIVQKGDSPWSIAERFTGSGKNYTQIMEASGLKPDATIYAGQTLRIPQSGFRAYTVKKGDSPWSIAAKELGSGSRWTEIAELNNWSGLPTIYAGDVLILPSA